MINKEAKAKAGSQQQGNGQFGLAWAAVHAATSTTSVWKRKNICSEFVCVGDGGGGLLKEVTKRQCAGAC